MNIFESYPLEISGSRFQVHYQILGDEQTVLAKAKDICVEQTIEYPADLLPEGAINDHVLGHIESITPIKAGCFQVVISFADEITGFELPQLINVIFGNISMKPGLRVIKVDISQNLSSHFKGPQFGIQGVRNLLNVHDRPLLFTAIKPLGLSSQQLANMAYQLALGGIDIIKDDHGIMNQEFAPFKERVPRIAEAVSRANVRTGQHTIYAPNITSPLESILDNARFAKSIGASGLLIMPGLCGFDTMRSIVDDPSIGLPIIMHPSLLGSYVLSEDFGISHYALHGQFARLCGADISVIPNYIGRFSYSRQNCIDVTSGCQTKMNQFRPIIPGVGGGISPDNFSDMCGVYGMNVAYLVSGNLHRQGPDLAASVRRFIDALVDL